MADVLGVGLGVAVNVWDDVLLGVSVPLRVWLADWVRVGLCDWLTVCVTLPVLLCVPLCVCVAVAVPEELWVSDGVCDGRHTSAAALQVPLEPHVSVVNAPGAGVVKAGHPITHRSPGRDAEHPPLGPSQSREMIMFRNALQVPAGTALAVLLGLVTTVGIPV